MLEGCAFMGEDGLLLAAPTCSFGCSQFWAGMDAGCRAYLQGNPLIQDEAGQVLSV